MNDKNGGPAFPQIDTETVGSCGEYREKIYSYGGMTLRDYFAAKAPLPCPAWIETQRQLDRNRNPHNDSYKPPLRDWFELCAAWNYFYADAMLAERVK